MVLRWSSPGRSVPGSSTCAAVAQASEVASESCTMYASIGAAFESAVSHLTSSAVLLRGVTMSAVTDSGAPTVTTPTSPACDAEGNQYAPSPSKPPVRLLASSTTVHSAPFGSPTMYAGGKRTSCVWCDTGVASAASMPSDMARERLHVAESQSGVASAAATSYVSASPSVHVPGVSSCTLHDTSATSWCARRRICGMLSTGAAKMVPSATHAAAAARTTATSLMRACMAFIRGRWCGASRATKAVTRRSATAGGCAAPGDRSLFATCWIYTTGMAMTWPRRRRASWAA